MEVKTHPHADKWLQSALRGEDVACDKITEQKWANIWKDAGENGVLALLQYTLKQTDVFSHCPSFIQKQLSEYTYQAVATEMLRQHDLQTTLELFTEKGLRFLLMKGAPLAYSLYPEPYLRERCDTDILFPDKQDAEAAWQVLEALGYQRRNTTSGEFVGYQYSCSRPVSHGFHQALDIHNRLNDFEFFAGTFEFDELYEQSVTAPEVAPSSRAFHPVHAFLHACMHRVAHIPRGEENRLIWLYDIHLLAHAFDQQKWKQVCTLAKEKGIAGVCLDGLTATQKTFQTELEPAILENLATSAQNEKFSPHKKGKRWEFYYLAFKSTPGLGNKMKQLRNHFFPSVDYMMKKYQPRSRLQLPYLYVYRVVKGVRRYF